MRIDRRIRDLWIATGRTPTRVQVPTKPALYGVLLHEKFASSVGDVVPCVGAPVWAVDVF